MLRNNITISNHANASIRSRFSDVQMAIWLYEIRGRSGPQIAKVFNCHSSTIDRLLRKNDIKPLHNNKAEGDKHGRWEGGKTKTAKYIRLTKEYKEWRKKVFERDKFTCQFCNKTGVRIEVDHIKPQSIFPEFRFNLDNGRTLCKPCHKKTDTYGSKAKKINK